MTQGANNYAEHNRSYSIDHHPMHDHSKHHHHNHASITHNESRIAGFSDCSQFETDRLMNGVGGNNGKIAYSTSARYYGDQDGEGEEMRRAELDKLSLSKIERVDEGGQIEETMVLEEKNQDYSKVTKSGGEQSIETTS